MSEPGGTSQPVPDGVYDVIVIDAVAHPDDEQRVGRIEITITSGEHKGATFGLNVADLVGTDVDLIGLPAPAAMTGKSLRVKK